MTHRFRLFPTAGFQIIIEPSSLEDSPWSERSSYLTDGITIAAALFLASLFLREKMRRIRPIISTGFINPRGFKKNPLDPTVFIHYTQ